VKYRMRYALIWDVNRSDERMTFEREFDAKDDALARWKVKSFMDRKNGKRKEVKHAKWELISFECISN